MKLAVRMPQLSDQDPSNHDNKKVPESRSVLFCDHHLELYLPRPAVDGGESVGLSASLEKVLNMQRK